MISKLALLLAAVPALVSATAIPTSHKNYSVQVGPNGTLTYEPPFVNAVPGDKVTFFFNPKNHTVTQSSFDKPCVPLDKGLDSKFMPVAANSTDPQPSFTVTVNDTKPLGFYCRQGEGTPAAHCSAGMVFVINPGPDGDPTSFTKFQDAAKGTKLNSTVPSGASSVPPAASSSPATDNTSSCGAATTVTVTVTPKYSEPPSYTQSSSYSAKPSSSKVPSYGTVWSSYTEKSSSSETPSYQATPCSEKPSYTAKPSSSETPSYGTVWSSYTEKPWSSETPSYKETPSCSDKPSSYTQMPSSTQTPSYGQY